MAKKVRWVNFGKPREGTGIPFGGGRGLECTVLDQDIQGTNRPLAL